MKVLIYGAGQTGVQVLRNIQNCCDVIGFLDGNPEKKGMEIEQIKVFGDIEQLDQLDYDKIYIGTVFWKSVKEKLLHAGVREEQIVVELPEDTVTSVRNTWLTCYGKLYSDSTLAVAEAGVYRGDFAAVINRCFPRSVLHLFDTFEGFTSNDVAIENKRYASGIETECFQNTSVDLVMSKMPSPDHVVIHKGHFPETAYDLEETFIFVNLDFDLYQPVLEGLRYFYPRMAAGAVLLVHDYYHAGLPGIKDAIEDYETETGIKLVKIPIGDYQSIGLVKIQHERCWGD